MVRAPHTFEPRSTFAACPEIQRLISARDIETLVVYDASDCQLYGRKHRQLLKGDLAQLAEDAGCCPEVYQSVYWWTLVYLPVKPLGVYMVMPCKTCDDPDGDADQYRGIRVPNDWMQISFHLLIGVLNIVCVALIIWAVKPLVL
jgi:hypothetical protein